MVQDVSLRYLQAQSRSIVWRLVQARVELYVTPSLRRGDLERTAGVGEVAFAAGVEVVVFLEARARGIVEGVYAHSEGEWCCHEGKEGGNVHVSGFECWGEANDDLVDEDLKKDVSRSLYTHSCASIRSPPGAPCSNF
jgi:hypothetical protein